MSVQGLDSKTTVLDVRKRVGHEQPRGAVRYDPKKLLEADRLVLPLPDDMKIVLVGDGDEVQIAEKLRANGYHRVEVFEGGIDAWKERGYRTEEPTQEQPIPGEDSAGLKLL